MARKNSEINDHPRKKQRVSSDIGATLGTFPSKTRRKRISRRISSGPSEPRSGRGRRQKAPTFYQPNEPPHPQGSQSARRHPHRPTASQESRDLDEGDGEDSDDNEGDGEDDEEEGDDAVLANLQRLTKYERYKAIGKIFALKIWPWPSSNWWIGDEGASAAPEEGSGPMKELAATKKLDAKKKIEFTAFLYIDMGIADGDWMATKFKSQVIIMCFAL